MSVINTNVSSLITQNALATNSRSLTKAMNQLSTGSRINSAADDAAGLAISNTMTSQIRGLNQAVRNANDGISLLQTAEGAMIEVTNMMQRMRELAVQSANDTNSNTERGYLNQEFQQLATEITRIRDTTTFNGQNLLNGTNSWTFQIGANASQTMAVSIGDIAGSAGTNGTPATSTEIAITAPDGTNGQVAAIDFMGIDTLAGTLAAGDKIDFKVADQNFSYTVTAADVTDLAAFATNNSDGVGDLLATKIATMINGNANLQGKVNASVTVDGTAVVTLTGVSVNDPFTVSMMVGATDATSVSGNISSRSAASTAITTLTTALAGIDSKRADLGAYINRLNYSADNLSNISTNTSASRSRILDTDYAKTTTELARAQIIQQAATAMLAQANQQPQSVLSLLK